jgi:hypothetical protein
MTIKRAEEGAWIFLSHSTKDFVKVSGLRNELENKGHRPLMFFLKCLDDDCEVDDLLKREIKARTWFILCHSVNSRSSRWVQSEVAYVKSLSDKVYQEIDLEQPLSAQISTVEPLLRRATVFISNAATDRAIAATLTTALRASDFGVFSDLDLSPSLPWDAIVRSQFEAAINRGFVLLLITPAFIRSPWGIEEARVALTWGAERQRGANVIPVYIGVRPSEISVQAGSRLGDIAARVQGFEVRTPERQDSFGDVVESLKRRPMFNKR